VRHVLLLALLVLLAVPAAANAHPLGNFSVNRLDVVRVSADDVRVTWILDRAEIPTFQERERSRAQLLAEARAVVRRQVRLEVDGRPVGLTPEGPGTVAFRPGQGGLRTTRIELELRAPAAGAKGVVLRDGSYADRVGWRAIVVRPAPGTAVRSSVSGQDPTNGLRVYPRALLSSPPDERTATLAVRPGPGTVTAPGADGAGLRTTTARGADGGFAALLADAAAGRGVLVLLLLAAAGWGALHALSPGHGKGMVAAYLVGSRGTAADAMLLGLTVTVSHTAGVFALGLVTLALSAWVLPEDLYPWLTLASGTLVVAVGASVLRGHVRRRRHARQHHHHDGHDHGHDHAPGRRGLLVLGASAGIIPCPSALVVLLGAIAQHELGLGLALIVAFSAGLAATLMGLGLAVVWARRMGGRLAPPARLAPALAMAPAVSSLVIIGFGVVLAARAVPTL
jgi:nickel/cobalt transporter (NicO) family protein